MKAFHTRNRRHFHENPYHRTLRHPVPHHPGGHAVAVQAPPGCRRVQRRGAGYHQYDHLCHPGGLSGRHPGAQVPDRPALLRQPLPAAGHQARRAHQRLPPGGGGGEGEDRGDRRQLPRPLDGHPEGGRLPGDAQDPRLPLCPRRPGSGLRRGVRRGLRGGAATRGWPGWAPSSSGP